MSFLKIKTSKPQAFFHQPPPPHFRSVMVHKYSARNILLAFSMRHYSSRNLDQKSHDKTRVCGGNDLVTVEWRPAGVACLSSCHPEPSKHCLQAAMATMSPGMFSSNLNISFPGRCYYHVSATMRHERNIRHICERGKGLYSPSPPHSL